MIWKAVFVVALAVGVLCEYKLTDAQHTQLRDMLQQQCKKNGADESSITAVENVGRNFVECVKTIVDVETIKQEIEAAKPNGALDEVFKKYCAKSAELKTCIHTLTAGVAPCIEPSLREHINSANNATDQLIDFVCYKDGDRIALFIAEQGPECFQEKANGIRECANKMKDTVPNVEAAKSLTLNEQCAKYDEFSACVVKSLEECTTPTPANMAEALFRFVRKGSPCKSITKV